MLHILSVLLSERKPQRLLRFSKEGHNSGLQPVSQHQKGRVMQTRGTSPFPTSELAKAQDAAQQVWSKQVSLKRHQIYCSK